MVVRKGTDLFRNEALVAKKQSSHGSWPSECKEPWRSQLHKQLGEHRCGGACVLPCVISQEPSLSKLTSGHTLWHKIITYEKLFWKLFIFPKLRISRVILWKSLSFPEILWVQNPSKTTNNNSQGIIFAIISCQRVFGDGRTWAIAARRSPHESLFFQIRANLPRKVCTADLVIDLLASEPTHSLAFSMTNVSVISEWGCARWCVVHKAHSTVLLFFVPLSEMLWASFGRVCGLECCCTWPHHGMRPAILPWSLSTLCPSQSRGLHTKVQWFGTSARVTCAFVKSSIAEEEQNRLPDRDLLHNWSLRSGNQQPVDPVVGYPVR